ncbi:uncharacterized protein LOC123924706 [Trifolium pratense]|uniref:uncharacterized protein LOC123924706 n=1 Tax=Trifolium pratense TaxID=57577 RepID=UPI001E6964A1|nr:uncharacterized protein LOC123924706 [Trifolium pratense]
MNANYYNFFLKSHRRPPPPLTVLILPPPPTTSDLAFSKKEKTKQAMSQISSITENNTQTHVYSNRERKLSSSVMGLDCDKCYQEGEGGNSIVCNRSGTKSLGKFKRTRSSDPVRDLTAALKYLVENRSLSSEEAQFACQHFNFEAGKTEVEMWLTFNEVTKVRYVKDFFSVRDKVKKCDHHWMPPRGCQGRQQRSSRTI